MKTVLYYEDNKCVWLLFDPNDPEDMGASFTILNYLKALEVYYGEEGEPYLESGPDEFEKMELLVEEWESLQDNQELLGVSFTIHKIKEE